MARANDTWPARRNSAGWKAINSAERCGAKAATVLMALLDVCSDNAWPTIWRPEADIADVTGLSAQQVRDAKKALCKAGLIQVAENGHRGKDGRGVATRYRALFDVDYDFEKGGNCAPTYNEKGGNCAPTYMGERWEQSTPKGGNCTPTDTTDTDKDPTHSDGVLDTAFERLVRYAKADGKPPRNPGLARGCFDRYAKGGGDVARLISDYSRYLDDVIVSHGGTPNAEGAKQFMKPLDKWLAEKVGA
nr:unnamed protein product [uncultured bacterium]